jgi:hypothetical protein
MTYPTEWHRVRRIAGLPPYSNAIKDAQPSPEASKCGLLPVLAIALTVWAVAAFVLWAANAYCGYIAKCFSL